MQLHVAPANVLVYSVDGKRFAHFKTSQPEQWRFSLKVSPERFLELTDIPGIKPARWCRSTGSEDVRAVPSISALAVEWSYQKAGFARQGARPYFCRRAEAGVRSR